MVTLEAGFVILLNTTQPQMTEMNVSANNEHPVTIKLLLTRFDIAIFLG